ncbi:MAG: winged helix-turn-helix domain-containing protein [Bryobacterales bacterium]|nr:winged helix-turn-helix domain-containing protein [Bryobacterales bacterium]
MFKTVGCKAPSRLLRRIHPPRKEIEDAWTFVLDPAAGEVRRNGNMVRLQGQPMRLLLLLLENPGQVVTREEMQQKLWSADTFVEFDAGLNTAIKKVRQALGDTAENPRFVETVPKIGYRFIAPVHPAQPVAAVPPATVSAPPPAPESKPARLPLGWIGVGAAVVLAAVIWWIAAGRKSGPAILPGPTRFEIVLPAGHSLGAAYSRGIALAPNGRTLVYSAYQEGQWRLFRREMNDLESHTIPGTEDSWSPVFTPDGGRIGLMQGVDFRTCNLDGSNSRVEVQISSSLIGGWATARWGRNGELYYSDAPAKDGSAMASTAIWVKQGESKRMLTGKLFGQGPEWHFVQELLPDGKHLLFSIVRTPEDRDIAVYSLETGESKVVVRGGTGGRYLPTGHLLYSVFTKGRRMYAAPFDLGELEVTGAAIELPAAGHDGWKQPTAAVSETGTLVYRAAPSLEANELMWVGLDGKQSPLPVAPGPYAVLDISADGGKLLIAKQEAGDSLWYVWRYELRSGAWARIPFSSRSKPQGIWAPDGARAVISAELHGSSLANLFLVDFEGAAPKRVWESRLGQFPSSWSRNGDVLAFVEGTRPDRGSDVWVKEMSSHAPARELMGSARFEAGAVFSPDGRWLAYAADGQVFVRAYPESKQEWLVADSGSGPLWAPDGKTIYFRRNGGVSAVSFQAGDTPVIGETRVVFEGQYAMPDFWTRSYSLSPDGKRFLMLNLEHNPMRDRTLRVVLNWFEELRGKT